MNIMPDSTSGEGVRGLLLRDSLATMKAQVTSAEETKKQTKDSLSIEERNKIFYDSLKVRSQRNKITKWLHEVLIVPLREDKSNQKIVDETQRYRPYEGKRIASIEIQTRNIYDTNKYLFQKITNSTHIVSRQRTIRRDLLFKRGDLLDPGVLVKNQQLIRSRGYIYDAVITVEENPDNSDEVVVKIVTRDNWSLGAEVTNSINISIFDVNAFGWGNKLLYKLSLNPATWRYEGSQFEYDIPNMLGTFFQANILAGRSFDREVYRVSVNKKLVLDRDYELGIEGAWQYAPYTLLSDRNRRVQIKYWYNDVWIGGSYRLENYHSKLYGMLRYNKTEFIERPEVSFELNPHFHNNSMILASAGIYLEQFLTTSLIYGYGVREYIATGYKAEVTGGYIFGEFDNPVYGAASLKSGAFTKIGYMSGELSLGSKYSPAYGFYQAAMNVKFNYFTNLFSSGRQRLRWFGTMNYTRGWERGEGSNEWITFTRESGPRGFRDYAIGQHRFVLNTELVMFTPWQPYDFRMALFWFFDAGLLGDHQSLFNNEFYSTIGFGIRMRNDRLLINTLQIRIGIAVGKHGLLRSEWYNIDGARRMQSMRYIPQKPQIIEYR